MKSQKTRLRTEATNPTSSLQVIIFQDSKSTSIKLLFYYSKIVYDTNIETITYKSKNPQVNLMGSNPNPRTSITSFSLKKK